MRSRTAPALRLVERTTDNVTVSVLKAVAARAADGRLRSGLTMYFESDDGQENIVLTGRYRDSHAHALMASARTMHRLIQAADDDDFFQQPSSDPRANTLRSILLRMHRLMSTGGDATEARLREFDSLSQSYLRVMKALDDGERQAAIGGRAA